MVEQLTKTCAEEAKMVDDNGSTPLHIACRGNPPLDVIQALLNAFPSTVCDQDVDGNTPLHIAASQPSMSLAVLEALLNVCPIAASVKNKEGLMPLHMTCRYAPTNDGVIEFLMTVNLGALECRTKVRQTRNRFCYCERKKVKHHAHEPNSTRWANWSIIIMIIIAYQLPAGPMMTMSMPMPICTLFQIWQKKQIWNQLPPDMHWENKFVMEAIPC